MSNWITIMNAESVDFDSSDNTINIYIGSDDFGNNYITVPIAFIDEAKKRVENQKPKP